MANITEGNRTLLDSLKKTAERCQEKGDTGLSTEIMEVQNENIDSKTNNQQTFKPLTASEKMEMLESLDLSSSHIKRIDASGSEIKLYLDNDIIYVIDRKDYNLVDVLDKSGSSIVRKIDMFSDEAANLDLYGGYQGSLANNDFRYIHNKTILSIIDKYYPNGNYTDDDLRLLFSKMNHHGCGYVAASNYMFELTKNLSDEEFYDKFGFSRYEITYASDGSYVKNYNYNCMFLDYFLYYQSELGFSSLSEIYGDIQIGAQDGSISGNYDDSGAQGSSHYIIARSIKSYLHEKKIDISYDNTFNYEKSFENLGQAVLNAISPLNDYFNGSKVRDALNVGKVVVIDMEDFTLYYPYDADGNGKLDDVERTAVGGHSMVVTGVTDDGGYIVSSWGSKYIVRPKAYSVYNAIEGYANGDDDNDTLVGITIYDI